MSANRTHGDELADVFTSFAIEKNPTGLSVGIDSAYELGDHIESEWLAEHDRQVAERAWDEAVESASLEETLHRTYIYHGENPYTEQEVEHD